MLLAAGYAPRFSQTPLDDEAMASVRNALASLLDAHDPFPAVVVDRGWDIVMSNQGAQRFLAGIPAALLQPPLNSYRLTLHPDGMAPRILNFEEWAWNLLSTLDRQVAVTRDPQLGELLDEVMGYPTVAELGTAWRQRGAVPPIVVPLHLRNDDGTIESWFSTNTTIGTPVDITLDGLHIELFHPMPAVDEASIRVKRR